MPKHFTRFALATLTALFAHVSQTLGQTSPQKLSSISGSVVSEEGALPDLTVILNKPGDSFRPQVVARTKTDAEGRYRFNDVTPGRYIITPLAHTYFAPELADWQPGKSLNVGEGENLEDVDFRLIRGGVIAGRITDPEGNPVIEERVNLTSEDPKITRSLTSLLFTRNSTDDRGEYRIYGLPPGRYRVVVGRESDGSVHIGGPNRFVRRTFYPGTTDETQARYVEVTAGGEASGIDIRVAGISKAFTVSGRIVEAETGKPVAGVSFGYGPVEPGSKHFGGYGSTGLRTNSQGEFRLEGLTPGRYGVFAFPMEGTTDWYSDAVTFEIVDEDVNGLEIKFHKGATVAGSVIIEGVGDPAVRARLLSQLSIQATTESDELRAPDRSPVSLAPDGSFIARGIKPGKLNIYFGWPRVKGASLLRVERNGIALTERIDVAPGSHVGGLRVVVGYGTSVIKGQVRIVGGALPEGARLRASARRVGSSAGSSGGLDASVDERGVFRIEGAMAGEYQIVLYSWQPGIDEPVTYPSTRRVVQVPENGEASVAVVLDLSKGASQ